MKTLKSLTALALTIGSLTTMANSVSVKVKKDKSDKKVEVKKYTNKTMAQEFRVSK